MPLYFATKTLRGSGQRPRGADSPRHRLTQKEGLRS